MNESGTDDASPAIGAADSYREEVLARWKVAEARLKAILSAEDPAGLIFEGENLDEYDGEAEALLAKIYRCKSSLEVRDLINELVLALLGAQTLGPIDRFSLLSERIWLEVAPLLQGRGVA